MYQYESKKTLKSAKSTSSDKGKKIASSRCGFSDLSPFSHSRQMPYTIQRSRLSTAILAAAESQYSAGSARPPIDELPDCFIEIGTNRRQAPKNIASSPLIITATAPMADNQYGAEATGRFNERTTACSGDLEFSDESIMARAEQVRSCWKAFLPEFLLKNGFKSYGANQSHTFHRLSNAAAESLNHQKTTRTKIAGMYNGSASIRKRRKYNSNEEIKRYLRHFAAALALNLRIEGEIQCYYDNNKVYVAANNDADITKLLKIDNEKISYFADVLQYFYKEIIQHEAENFTPAIQAKFQGKPKKTIASDPKNNPLLRRLRHSLNCPCGLGTAEIEVIKGNYGITGLHAERKILYCLREKRNNNELFLDPLRLGGIRRPCFICSALCFADMSQVYPGPVWVSNAASRPRDINEMFLILNAIRNKENVTFISFNNGRLTMDNDSDSCSDERSECD